MKAYWHEQALISGGESDIENTSDLCFLIMTSDVGTMGLNLHHAYDRVVLSAILRGRNSRQYILGNRKQMRKDVAISLLSPIL